MPKSLSRQDNHRRSMLRNQATSLILYEEITTTAAKAKETKSIVEHLLALARKNDLAARRRLLAYLFDPKAVAKVFEVLVQRYQKVESGMIQVFKIGPRLGDNAPQVILKLKEIDRPKENDGQKGSAKKANTPAKTRAKRSPKS